MNTRFASSAKSIDTAARLARLPIEIDHDMAETFVGRRGCYRIALLVPLCGTAGLWTPSSIASAQVAVEELNRQSGINGREIQLILIDAALEAPVPAEEVLEKLLRNKAVDAIVGMHISAIRQRLSRVIRQRVPFIYTPIYEGGERTPGIFAIGETPGSQLGPAMEFLQEQHKIRRWALIGNDYVWPRVSHSYARRKIRALDGTLVYERYLPFGPKNMKAVLEDLEKSGADGVLMSLVGQDAVDFNRLFGKMDLHTKMVRLSSALEENGLLASGSKGVKRLYSAASYFGGLRTETNSAFREKYYAMHGDYAPVLNTLGQSTYEGVHYLAALISHYAQDWHRLTRHQSSGFAYRSARWQSQGQNGGRALPVYVSRADGLQYDVIKSL